MYEKIVIKQPAGLGDIFFCLKIAYAFHKQFSCDIIWPVIPQFMWLKDYIKYPFIQFVNQEKDYPLKNQIDKVLYSTRIPDVRVLEVEENNKKYILIPLQHADLLFPGLSVMEAKYKFIDLDFSDWRDFFQFERNINKENQLYYKVLKLTDSSNYTLINKQYGSPPGTVICPKIDSTKFSNYVEMYYVEGYTLFDCCKLIENAKEI